MQQKCINMREKNATNIHQKCDDNAMKMKIYLNASALEGIPQLQGLPIILVTRVFLVRWIALGGIVSYEEALASWEIHLLVRGAVGQPLVDHLVWVDGGARTRPREVTLRKANIKFVAEKMQ